MIPLLYMALIVAISLWLRRSFPAPVFGPQSGANGPVLLGIVLTAALVGWHMPDTLVGIFGWGEGPRWLTRIAQLVGAGGLAYIVVRGVVLWLVLFGLGIVAAVVFWLFQFIFG